MVIYRVRIKDTQKLRQMIVDRYETLKHFTKMSGIATSTIHRILNTGQLSYYAASRIGTLLDVEFYEMFEIIRIKEDL